MGYINPDALVSTGELAGLLGTVRLVDATHMLPTMEGSGRDAYDDRHIPGAVFFDIDAISDDGTDLPHMLPGPKKFSSMVGGLGLGDGDRIVVYDCHGGFLAAARVWWMFRAFGHDDVALLDGGLPKWMKEERPLDGEIPDPPRRQFTARPNPDLLRGLGQMLENLDSGRELVVDARNAPRFRGLAPEPRPAGKLGHIPGSVNMPISDLMDPGDGFIMRPAAELTRVFEELDPKRPVVASCGSGVTAAVIAFSAHLLGLNDIAVYDGSWAEWGNRDDTPVETGESP